MAINPIKLGRLVKNTIKPISNLGDSGTIKVFGNVSENTTKFIQNAQSSYGKSLLKPANFDNDFFSYFSKKWGQNLDVEKNIDNIQELLGSNYADCIKKITTSYDYDYKINILGLISKENIEHIMPLWNKRGTVGLEKVIADLLKKTNNNNVKYANIIANVVDTNNAKSIVAVYDSARDSISGNFARKLLENLTSDNAKYAKVMDWLGGTSKNNEIQQKLITLFKKAGNHREGYNLRHNILDDLDKFYQSLEKDITLGKINPFEGLYSGRIVAMKHLLSHI